MSYKYTDRETGMTVKTKDRIEQNKIPSLFQAATKRANNLLQSGEFKEGVDSETAKMRAKTLTAQALETSEENVDVDKGIDLLTRAQLDFQQGPEKKLQFLEKRYGKENLKALNVGNQNKIFYRDEKETDNKWRTVDEYGRSFSDFTVDILGEVAPTLASVGGAVAGIPGGPVGMAAGSAAAYGAVAGAQDVAAGVLGGTDVDLEEIGMRRGGEALLGGAIDFATFKVGSILSKIIPSGVKTAMAESVENALSFIKQQTGLAPAPTPGIMKSEAGSQAEGILAKKYPSSPLGRAYSNIENSLEAMENALRTGNVDPDAVRAKFAQDFVDELNDLTKVAAAADTKASEALRETIIGALKRHEAPEVALERVGREFRNNHYPKALKAIENETGRLYDDAEKLLSGVEIPAKALSNKLIRSMNKIDPNNIMQKNEIEAILAEISELDTINLQAVRTYKDRINDLIGSNKVAGFAQKEKAASAAFKAIDDLIVARAPANARKALREANKYYKNVNLKAKRRAVGAVTKERLGDELLGDEQATKRILSSAQEIRDTLDVLKLGGVDPQPIKESLKTAYLNQLGFIGPNMTPELIGGINFDRGVVMELFGKGKINELDRLKQVLSNPKLKGANISEADIQSYLTVATQKQKNAIIKEIRRKAINETKRNEFLANQVFDAIVQKKPWGYQAISNKHVRDKMLTAPNDKFSEAIGTIKQRNPEMVEALRIDAMNMLFEAAQYSAPPGAAWNVNAFIRMLGTNKKNATQFAKNLEDIAGETYVQSLRDLNKLAKEVTPVGAGVTKDAQLRANIGPALRPVFYVVGSMIDPFKNRFLAWAHGQGFLREMLSKNLTPEESLQWFRDRVVPMMISAEGMNELAQHFGDTPESTEALAKMIQELSSEQ